MKYQHDYIHFLRSLTFLLLTLSNSNFASQASSNSVSLKTLPLDGHLCFDEVHQAATDFGNRFSFLPSMILHPKSVSDISTVVRHIWQAGPNSEFTVAVRGNGHSLQGQSQAQGGLVIDMGSMRGNNMRFDKGKYPYVDVSGGELWINVLQESLKLGLSPKSWTDYLYLSVGGTLSNAGVSGQAFKHGPQISSVLELEVVTGKGEVVNCSKIENTELFHGVLGGLGQFGIITRARISLQPAPKMVKWIRVLYSDFSTFARDQEYLISKENKVDYIEGFVQINRTGLLDNWRASFNSHDPVQASQFVSDGKTLFCLELAKNFNPQYVDSINKEIEDLLSKLSYISSTLFTTEVAYIDFLNRVHASEIKLRSKGLWEVPHPWLNLLIPKTKIHSFAQEVFGNILTDSSKGPILIYPLNKSKWDNRTSVVMPDEDIFYLVGLLPSVVPSSAGVEGLERILLQNKRIIDFCETAKIKAKQYLPHYMTQEEWKVHFGSRWDVFRRRKSTYDPLAILAPGHRIFQKEIYPLYRRG